MSATGSTPPAPSNRMAQAGFTLIELLVAVGIMALIASIAFPALQTRLAARTVDATSASVRLALAEARGEALASGAPVTLTLAADGTVLAFGNGRTPLPLPDGHPALDWPRDGMTFHPDGSAQAAGATLSGLPRNAAAPQRRFAVDANDGRIVTTITTGTGRDIAWP